MRVSPKSEAELVSCFPAGVYDAEVLKAEDKVSKTSGNDMIELKIKVYGFDDETLVITDYLLDKMPKKLRHFCDAAGLLPLYESGELQASDCQGASVKVRLKVERDPAGAYDDKNTVADYIVERVPTQPQIEPRKVNYGAPMADPNAALQEAAAERDPDIPFALLWTTVSFALICGGLA